ncbi:hypothetical protein KU644_23910, partial [Salmonella enterica subsp. enterica serovar Kentucky]|nr:hypothetical protein [Salmonella enterica subsp. enterica serovar Kentucky]
LTVTAAPATATTPHSGSCHEISQGYRSWVGITTTHIDCAVAHDIGKRWTGNCGRSASTVAAKHCELPVTVEGSVLMFHCANTKAAQSPDHYHVQCHHNHTHVSFTYYAYGF